MAENVFNTAVLGFNASNTTHLSQIGTVSVPQGLLPVVQPSGSVDATFAGSMGVSPRVTFDTPALETMFGLVGFAPINIDETYVYIPQLAHGGTRAGGSTAIKLTLYDSLAILRSFTASQGGEAAAAYEFIGTYDGSNAPLAIAIDQAMPEIPAPATPEKFTVGPANIGNTPIDVQSLTFNSGIAEIVIGKNGEPYPRFAAGRYRQPTFTIMTHDIELVSSMGLLEGASDDNAIIYFRSLLHRAGPVIDATAAHIKLTAVDSFVWSGAITSDANGAAMVPVNVQPAWDGTNAIVQIAVNQAIT